MDNPAVIAADYFNFEYKKGLKVCRLTFEVPYEHAKLVRDVLGDPPLPGTQVRVAIARLAKDAAEQSSSRLSGSNEQGPVAQEEQPISRRVGGESPSGSTKREYTRSQIAAMKCRDPEFQAWLQTQYDWTVAAGHDAADTTSNVLKSILGIASKSDLDKDGPKADAFDKLMTDFKVRDYVR